ncbi:unnamed protein product [Acanthoscelides obtectus]|uniref:Uncharacterized protein n=1 Tax=Acanthoscelides obtectus TaxID=200917 RepID=A0A9P0KD98_ACAOB|nr:unnamed protein product [Acanthoscelides obtectus]CAK1625593.1 hypothetical protein AOBTE_LOCUS3254 [Acanthoscelides obtectus]
MIIVVRSLVRALTAKVLEQIARKINEYGLTDDSDVEEPFQDSGCEYNSESIFHLKVIWSFLPVVLYVNAKGTTKRKLKTICLMMKFLA